MWLAATIAAVGIGIGYIIGHQLGFKQAMGCAHAALETMLLKAMTYVPHEQREQAIEGVRRSLRSL